MAQYGSDYGYRDQQRRYPDEGYYGVHDDARDRDYPRGGYYDRDYGQDFGSQGSVRRDYVRQDHGRQDYGRDSRRDVRHYAEEARDWAGTTAGIGTGAAILALAAFGIGVMVGSRWHAESYERVSGMPRSDLRRTPTLDDYHGHVSINDPDATAGTPPDADAVVGREASGKSARESAETLRNADRRESAESGDNGGKRNKS